MIITMNNYRTHLPSSLHKRFLRMVAIIDSRLEPAEIYYENGNLLKRYPI